jgi:hypothetical protein
MATTLRHQNDTAAQRAKALEEKQRAWRSKKDLLKGELDDHKQA